jgi:hypothetical protein
VVGQLVVEITCISQCEEPRLLVGLQCLGDQVDGFVVPCNS